MGYAQSGKFGIVGLKRADSLAVHADAPSHKIRLDRNGVAITLLDARDLAVTFEARECLLQDPQLLAWQAELAQQTGRVERRVIGPAQ